MNEELKKLLNQQKALLDKAKTEGRVFTAEERTLWNDLQAKINATKEQLEAEKQFQNNETFINAPAGTPHIVVKNDDKPVKLFKNFTEQLIAVKTAANSGVVDNRLVELNTALGMNEGSGQDGAFGVQADFAGAIMDTSVKEDPILSRVDSYSVSQNSDRVQYLEVDESDISTTVFGGVQVYWAEEAGTVGASKPKLMEKELKLQKLMGFAYATEELNADSNFIDQLYTKAFSTAIRRALAGAIIAGNGVGKPLGLLKAGSLITIAKESNQAAGTVVWANLSKMYNRVLDKSKCVWLCHPDVREQFDFLEFPVGTGGVPVYLPAAAAGSIDTLRGKPILESDHCSAVGSQGDLLFVDLSDYMMIYKGGVQKDVSIHVQFLTAENCFRFIFRANGLPKRNKKLTIKNSSNDRSSIVTLAARG
jgi:HK97 family phage major capsid protein